MQNKLKIILKIEKHKLEQMIDEMNKIQSEKSVLEQDLILLNAESRRQLEMLASEKKFFDIQHYNELCNLKKSQLLQQIELLNSKEFYAQAKVQEQFAEMKKVEIVMKKKKKEHMDALEKKYQSILDSVKINRKF